MVEELVDNYQRTDTIASTFNAVFSLLVSVRRMKRRINIVYLPWIVKRKSAISDVQVKERLSFPSYTNPTV